MQVFDNPFGRPFGSLWRAKEDAIRTHNERSFDFLAEQSQPLRLLHYGEEVFIQNQDESSKNY